MHRTWTYCSNSHTEYGQKKVKIINNRIKYRLEFLGDELISSNFMLGKCLKDRRRGNVKAKVA